MSGPIVYTLKTPHSTAPRLIVVDPDFRAVVAAGETEAALTLVGDPAADQSWRFLAVMALYRLAYAERRFRRLRILLVGRSSP